jgi:hypothetical protein
MILSSPVRINPKLSLLHESGATPDTFVFNVDNTDLGQRIRHDIDASLALQLNEWNKLAQKLGESFIMPWVFNNASLKMQPNGPDMDIGPGCSRRRISPFKSLRASGTVLLRHV